MKYFFILIIAFLIPNIANANNFNFECSGWYIDEDNKKILVMIMIIMRKPPSL